MSDSVTPWTVARQAPLSMGFSRQEYWSGLPCPPPGDLLNPGIEPVSSIYPALAGEFFTIELLLQMHKVKRILLGSDFKENKKLASNKNNDQDI